MIDRLILSILSWLGKLLKWSEMPSYDRIGPPEGLYVPSSVTVPGKDHVTYSQPVVTNLPIMEPHELLWDTQKHAFHSVRMLCDEMGLSYDEKNIICATIYGESEFNNNAICKNRNNNGEVTSIDVGICQINSYWHTGIGKTFPSTDYVISHPDEAVKFMIKMYKTGKINLWIAYKNGRYLQFLPKTSPMWKLT